MSDMELQQELEKVKKELHEEQVRNKKLNQRQYRSFDVAAEQGKNCFDSEYYIEGYATTFQPYELYRDCNGEPVYELIESTAFEECDMSDVIFLYDHAGKVLARMSNNTLKVSPDDTGLFVCADLGKSEAAKEIFGEIQAGLITKMSWGFEPDADGVDYDVDTHTIHQKRIRKMYDVSAVGIPANNDTEIYARSFGDGVIEKAEKEILESEVTRKRKILELKLTLEGECK